MLGQLHEIYVRSGLARIKQTKYRYLKYWF
jgi:hypothetical protein